MNFVKLKAMVEQDSQINACDLDKESLRLPQLHNKYLILMMEAKSKLEMKQFDYNKMLRLKWEYYSGKMDQKTLDRYNWEQFDLKILKQDLHMYLDSDDDLYEKKKAVAYYKELCSYLESVVKEVSFRHMKIRNAIDWNKFQQGS